MTAALVVAGLVVAGVWWARSRRGPAWVVEAERLGFRRRVSAPVSVARGACELADVGGGRVEVMVALRVPVGCLFAAATAPSGELGGEGGGVVVQVVPWSAFRCASARQARELLEAIEPTAVALARGHSLVIRYLLSTVPRVDGVCGVAGVIVDANVGLDGLREAISAAERLAERVDRAAARVPSQNR